MCLDHIIWTIPVTERNVAKVVEAEDLYIVENYDPKEKVDADKKVVDKVKIEKDESLGLDDCSIDHGPDWLTSIPLTTR